MSDHLDVIVSYLQTLPPGMEFSPDNDELVGSFLCNRVTAGQQAPYETVFIPDCDLYRNHEPWEIFDAYGGDDNSDLYVFTKLKKKDTKEGKRIDRSIGRGTWHQENKADDFDAFAEAKGEWVSAIKKRFNYRNKDRPDQDGRWILIEVSSSSVSKDFVSCILRKNIKNRKQCTQEHKMSIECVLRRRNGGVTW